MSEKLDEVLMEWEKEMNRAKMGMEQKGRRPFNPKDEEWFDEDSLYTHHLREVYSKYDTLEDDIWCKIICMERNRRVAKAYCRVPVVTVDGSSDGFDGFKVGLAAFQNPSRDKDVRIIKEHIGDGIKLKVDKDGSILCKRLPGSQKVIIKGIDSPEKASYSQDVYDMEGMLDMDKPVKIFDMKEFRRKVDDELTQPYHNKKRLQFLCFVSLSFVVDTKNCLKTPCWLMVLNISALDYLNDIMAIRKRNHSSHSSLLDVRGYGRRMPEVSIRERIEMDRMHAAMSPTGRHHDRDSLGESYTPPSSPPSPPGMNGSQYLDPPHFNGMYKDRGRSRRLHSSPMLGEPIYVPTGYPSYGFPTFGGGRPTEFKGSYYDVRDEPDYRRSYEGYHPSSFGYHDVHHRSTGAVPKYRQDMHANGFDNSDIESDYPPQPALQAYMMRKKIYDLTGMDTVKSKLSERMKDGGEAWVENDPQDDMLPRQDDGGYEDAEDSRGRSMERAENGYRERPPLSEKPFHEMPERPRVQNGVDERNQLNGTMDRRNYKRHIPEGYYERKSSSRVSDAVRMMENGYSDINQIRNEMHRKNPSQATLDRRVYENGTGRSRKHSSEKMINSESNDPQKSKKKELNNNEAVNDTLIRNHKNKEANNVTANNHEDQKFHEKLEHKRDNEAINSAVVRKHENEPVNSRPKMKLPQPDSFSLENDGTTAISTATLVMKGTDC